MLYVLPSCYSTQVLMLDADNFPLRDPSHRKFAEGFKVAPDFLICCERVRVKSGPHIVGEQGTLSHGGITICEQSGCNLQNEYKRVCALPLALFCVPARSVQRPTSCPTRHHDVVGLLEPPSGQHLVCRSRQCLRPAWSPQTRVLGERVWGYATSSTVEA
jgi:hypothetical protein